MLCLHITNKKQPAAGHRNTANKVIPRVLETWSVKAVILSVRSSLDLLSAHFPSAAHMAAAVKHYVDPIKKDLLDIILIKFEFLLQCEPDFRPLNMYVLYLDLCVLCAERLSPDQS